MNSIIFSLPVGVRRLVTISEGIPDVLKGGDDEEEPMEVTSNRASEGWG
jgi:hypothetical protein